MRLPVLCNPRCGRVHGRLVAVVGALVVEVVPGGVQVPRQECPDAPADVIQHAPVSVARVVVDQVAGRAL
eukprot:8585645-Lingulodinium_polyedra.AAC.1